MHYIQGWLSYCYDQFSWDCIFFLLLISQNQSAVGYVIQLNKKKNPNLHNIPVILSTGLEL